MLKEMQREVNTGRPFETRYHIDYFTHDHFSQFRSASDLDCCFMAILSWRNPPGPRIMRKIWSNTRERTQGKEKEQAEDSSYPKGIVVLLRETIRKGYPDPENVDGPTIARQDDDVRQSRRVLELQNRELWIRPNYLSWHFPILITIREMSFRKYRGRSLAKLEARDEAKKQKTLKKRDTGWNSARWNQSSWTWATSSSSSSWREWSSDETHEQESKDTRWQSRYQWQRGHLHRSSQGHPWKRK